MSRIRIVHRSGYDYDPWAMASHNEVRMAPKATHQQLVLSHKLEITPTAWQHSYVDYWGTAVLAFEIHEKHPQLSIVATSEVDVQRPDSDTVGISWEHLDQPELQDTWCEFLEITPVTDIVDVLGEQVAHLKGQAATPARFATLLSEAIRREISYMQGVTGVHSRAVDAWNARAGVCQDMSHLMIGGLRLAGIPARYVSGYHVPMVLGSEADSADGATAERAAVGVPVAGESHSWVQFWDGQWSGIDPSTGQSPDDLYVEVAHGRDYFDVAPLTGIFTGGQTAAMFVEVTLTRLS